MHFHASQTPVVELDFWNVGSVKESNISLI